MKILILPLFEFWQVDQSIFMQKFS